MVDETPSSPEQVPEERRAPSDDEVIAYFSQDSEFPSKCPVCGTASWTFYSDQESGMRPVVPLRGKKDGVVLPPRTIPVYMIVCAKCAFVRLHARGVVDERVREWLTSTK